MRSAHHHLSVNDEVNREDDCSDASVDNLEDSVVRDEDHDEATDEEHEEDAEHDTPARSEVYLGL